MLLPILYRHAPWRFQRLVWGSPISEQIEGVDAETVIYWGGCIGAFAGALAAAIPLLNDLIFYCLMVVLAFSALFALFYWSDRGEPRAAVHLMDSRTHPRLVQYQTLRFVVC